VRGIELRGVVILEVLNVGQTVVSSRSKKRKYPNRHDKDHASGDGSRHDGHSTLGSKGVCVPKRGLFCDYDIRVSGQQKGREMVLRAAQKESEMAFSATPKA
jgi:hypothetical protein